MKCLISRVDSFWIMILIVTLSSPGYHSQETCSDDFCNENGKCSIQASNSRSCTCFESYYGNQCQEGKKSFAAVITISKMTIGSQNYEGSNLQSALASNTNNLRQDAMELTTSAFRLSLNGEPTYLGGTLFLSSSSDAKFKLEFMTSSTFTEGSLKDKLASSEFYNFTSDFQDSKNGNIRSITLGLSTVRDFDECSEAAVNPCRSGKSCENTKGSFKCESESNLNWKQILIWGGIVLVILFWMAVAMVCAAKRRNKKKDANSRKDATRGSAQSIPDKVSKGSPAMSIDNVHSRRGSFSSTDSFYAESYLDAKRDPRIRTHSDMSRSSSPGFAQNKRYHPFDSRSLSDFPDSVRSSFRMTPPQGRTRSSLPNVLEDIHGSNLLRSAVYGGSKQSLQSAGLRFENDYRRHSGLIMDNEYRRHSGLIMDNEARRYSGLIMDNEARRHPGLVLDNDARRYSGLMMYNEARRNSGLSIENEVRRHSGLSIENEARRHSGLSIENEARRHSGLSMENEARRYSGLSMDNEARRYSGLSMENEARRYSGLSMENEARRYSGLSMENEARRHSGASMGNEARSHSGDSMDKDYRRHSGLSMENEARRYSGASMENEARRYSGASMDSDYRRHSGASMENEARRYSGASMDSDYRRHSGLTMTPPSSLPMSQVPVGPPREFINSGYESQDDVSLHSSNPQIIVTGNANLVDPMHVQESSTSSTIPDPDY